MESGLKQQPKYRGRPVNINQHLLALWETLRTWRPLDGCKRLSWSIRASPWFRCCFGPCQSSTPSLLRPKAETLIARDIAQETCWLYGDSQISAVPFLLWGLPNAYSLLKIPCESTSSYLWHLVFADFAGKILKDLFAFTVVLYFAGSRQKLKSYHSWTSAGNVLLVSMFWSCFGVKFEAPCFQMYLSIPTIEPYNCGLTHKMTRKTSTKNTLIGRSARG